MKRKFLATLVILGVATNFIFDKEIPFLEPIKDEIISFFSSEEIKTPKVERLTVKELTNSEVNNIIEELDKIVVKDSYVRTMEENEDGIIVGYNYNISKKGISKEAASIIIEKEIGLKRKEFNKFSWFTELDQVRQDAVLNMAFNLGTTGFFKFKNFISYLEVKDFDRASDELLYNSNGGKSIYHRQVGKRAREIAKQIKKGKSRRNLLTTLKKHEGYSRFPYKDSRGVWTIGYGINLEDRGLEKDEALMVMAYAFLDDQKERG